MDSKSIDIYGVVSKNVKYRTVTTINQLIYMKFYQKEQSLPKQ